MHESIAKSSTALVDLSENGCPIRLYSAASAEENWELLDYIEFLNARKVTESDIEFEVDLDDSDVSFKLFLSNFMKFSCLLWIIVDIPLHVLL